jgi:hypothetical protein
MSKLDALGGIIADLGDDLAHQMKGNADLFGDFRAGAVQQLSIFEPGGYLGEAVEGIRHCAGRSEERAMSACIWPSRRIAFSRTARLSV